MRKKKETIHSDVIAGLSSLEKTLIKRQMVMTVRGKRNSPVPLLIPEDCLQCLDFISNEGVRHKMNINNVKDDHGNQFLFANTGIKKKVIMKIEHTFP